MHFLHVVGARPNFMKAAPLLRALDARVDRQTLVHSGQHYDYAMSGVFFEQLGMRAPDVNLEVGSASHARQTAAIMSRFEPVLLESHPDVVIVYGDVNSTVAVAMVCAKLGVRLVHVEAGLRSFDRRMPEEINRIVTDQLADVLLTPSTDADENLRREGIATEKIHLVGNIMIDTLVRLLPLAVAKWGLMDIQEPYGLVTLHRPSNVDDPRTLSTLIRELENIATRLPLTFPVHPRLRERLSRENSAINYVEPMSYVEFLALQKHAALVITDSGGMQEETTYLGVPCLTLRENTERPVTVEIGTNTLVGVHDLSTQVDRVLCGEGKRGQVPPLWDGRTAERICDVLVAAKRKARNVSAPA